MLPPTIALNTRHVILIKAIGDRGTVSMPALREIVPTLDNSDLMQLIVAGIVEMAACIDSETGVPIPTTLCLTSMGDALYAVCTE